MVCFVYIFVFDTSVTFQLTAWNRKMSVICRKLIVKGFPNTFIKLCKHSTSINKGSHQTESSKRESKRMAEFRKKLRETTPIDDLGEQEIIEQKDNALPPWPNNTNPHTGEIGGPKGPEPTRFGDWERKGRVSDF